MGGIWGSDRVVKNAFPVGKNVFPSFSSRLRMILKAETEQKLAQKESWSGL